MKNLEIIYEDSKHADFLLFSEFFKLCGVFVIRSYAENLPVWSDRWSPDKELDLRKIEELKYHDRNEFQILLRGIDIFIGSDGRKEELDQEADELKRLADIYIRRDLKRYNTLERYFYFPTKKRLFECRLAFHGAYNEIKRLQEDEKEKKYGKYMEHFSIMCQHKINALQGKLKQEKIYKGYDLIKRAIRLGEQYNDRICGYILAGIIADGDLNYLTYSIDFYNSALKWVQRKEQEDTPICGYVLFRRARYYEKIENNYKKALEDYEKASKRLGPKRYRALYKTALLKLERGYIDSRMSDILEARADFYKIHDCLAQDLSKKNLEPIQWEYLTKALKKIYEIYNNWLNEKNNAGQILWALCLVNEWIEEDKFFTDFFKEEEADKEKQLLIQHLNIKQYLNQELDFMAEMNERQVR